MKGDFIELDLMRTVSFTSVDPKIRLLIDAPTMQILLGSRWDTSGDGIHWVSGLISPPPMKSDLMNVAVRPNFQVCLLAIM